MNAHQHHHNWFICIGVVLTTGLLLAGCGDESKPFTIGVINNAPILTPAVEGFKAGLADLGYVEGEDVIYIYNGVVEPNSQAIDAEIGDLLARDIDLLFPVGISTTQGTKKVITGTDIPGVFCAVVNPVGEGIVESISSPGGSLTGVQVSGNDIPKALEWLVTIVPEVKTVYVPYNSGDKSSTAALGALNNAVVQLGIELMLDEVFSVEEAVAAIESLPEDVNAIFRIPSPTLDPRNSELSQAAIARGIPMGAGLPLDEAVLIVFAIDLFAMGKQAARLAHQIRQGAKPADLPVETAEILLTINLKTADAIGLDISDEVLLQADTIIR